MKTDLEQAERQNFYFGAKIVRGAYIEQVRHKHLSQNIWFIQIEKKDLKIPEEKSSFQQECDYFLQERARAAAMGYADPTNPTYEATTESYHKTLMECLRRMKQYKDKGEDPKKIGIMVASHNEDTVRFAIEK